MFEAFLKIWNKFFWGFSCNC